MSLSYEKNFSDALITVKGHTWDSLISWVPIFVDEGNLTYTWIFNFMVLPKSAYKPFVNLSFVELLISWFNYTHESHKNWSPTNNNESTVTKDIATVKRHT